MVKKIIMVLIVLIIIAAAVFGIRFLLIQNNEAAENKKIETICADFSKNQGEISCQEAVKIALAKYPGEALSVRIFNNHDTSAGKKNIWLITDNLKDSILVGGGKVQLKAINIGVDRSQSDILFFTEANI